MAYGTNVATFGAPLTSTVSDVQSLATGPTLALQIYGSHLWPCQAIKPLCVWERESERGETRKTIANWQTKFHNNVRRRPNWRTTTMASAWHFKWTKCRCQYADSDIFDDLLTLESRWVQRQALGHLKKSADWLQQQLEYFRWSLATLRASENWQANQFQLIIRKTLK